MRTPVGAVAVATLVAAAAAVILGEYELVGLRPVLAGLLFGVAVGEVVATVGKTSDRYVLAAVALLAQAGLVWATWISTGHDLGRAAGTAWLGIVAGSVAAPLWLRSAGRRGAHTLVGTTPAPGG